MLKKLRIIKKLDTEREQEIKNKEKTSRIRWTEHKEKLILYIDYSNLLNTDETIKTILEVNDFIKKLGKYELQMLVDVRNSNVNEKIVVDALKNNALTVKPYVKKAAVVGVTTIQEVILTVVNMFSSLGLKPFETIDDAKDWLIK
jgi:chemotaxis signal transduction protein